MARLIAQLVSLALGHGCVDGCATMINPLIRARAGAFGMSAEALAWPVTIVMTITCSCMQPLIALWSDRWGARWAALAAPFVAGVGMAAAIRSASAVWLSVWLGMCGLAVAVYHPIPAAIVGDLLPGRRTFSLAIFLGGGMLGLGVGPIAVSYLLEQMGRDGGWWLLIASGPVAIALLASCGLAKNIGGQSQTLDSLREAIRGRGRTMFILVTIASARALATMGPTLGITLLTERQATSITWTGWLLSAFLFSGGVTGLASGLFFHPRRERGVLVVTSVVAFAAVAIMPFCSPIWMLVFSVIAGAALQGVNPIIVAMSQRILPSGSRMASSLVMGWSWGVGGLLGLIVTVVDPVEWAIVGVGSAMIPAAILALRLPLVPEDASPATSAVPLTTAQRR